VDFVRKMCVLAVLLSVWQQIAGLLCRTSGGVLGGGAKCWIARHTLEPSRPGFRPEKAENAIIRSDGDRVSVVWVVNALFVPLQTA
jgi:hypothetical protein